MTRDKLIATNIRVAKSRWPEKLTRNSIGVLRSISARYRFSIPAGDLLLLENNWYVTHTGLVGLAWRRRCSAIDACPVTEFCDAGRLMWMFKATVYKSTRCRGFVGYGDADPSNVSPRVRGAEMRVAETRAVNRALRKAYGIGICSVEELGSFSGPLPPGDEMRDGNERGRVGNGSGHHPMRDRLCLLIRQHQLDPALVKAYAADFCEVNELRHASREQVASFIQHLDEYAHNDREGLLCQLDSYAPKPVSAAIEVAKEITPIESGKAEGAA